MTDIPMSPEMYSGPATPFGGPSLEWYFSNIVITQEESEEAKLSIRGLPVSIKNYIIHLRRNLPGEYPQNSANVQRKILTVGIPIIEIILQRYPSIRENQDKALMESSVSDTREVQMRGSYNYVFNLGPEDSGQTTIFAKNKDQTSKVRNIAEDSALPASKITILCLTAGLAQSVDPLWVSSRWKDTFINEVKFFEHWLSEKK